MKSNKKSSKIKAQKMDKLLNTIRRVEVSNDLYNKILIKIQQKQAPVINLWRASFAAAAMLCLFAFEAQTIYKNLQKTTLTTAIIPSTNNNLYHE
jgi:hypothetical protein